MPEYDSILKEKKKNTDSEITNLKKKKHFPWLKIDIFCILIILCISYIVYYRTILAADKIFLSDLSKLADTYQVMLKHFNLDKLNTKFQIEGTIQFENSKYNYGIIRDQENIKLDLSTQEHYLLYYLNSEQRYIQLSNFMENYIELEEDSYFKVLRELKNNFLIYINKDQYIKKFYIDGHTPIVEANLVLKEEDIKQILTSSTINNSYEVLFTFKNHALTNEIISMKAVINNVNNGKRYVITYQDGELTYSDGENNNWKFVLEKNQEDFNLKIYQEEILYSVLSGEDKKTSYQYTYLIIDQIYNIVLNIKEESDGYLYEFSSNIEKDNITTKRSVQVTLHYQEDTILEKNIEKSIKYNTMTQEEQARYQIELENILSDLRQFIEEYK